MSAKFYREGRPGRTARREKASGFDSYKTHAKAVTLKDIELPPHIKLHRKDAPYLDAIIRKKPIDFWVTETLYLAWQLARFQRQVVEQTDILDTEELVVKRGRAWVPNPRIRVIRNFNTTMWQLARALRLARAAGVDVFDNVRERVTHMRDKARKDGILS